MSLKDKLLSSHIVFQESLDPDSPIYDVRNEAIKHFEEAGFPSKKDEAWKYTSLNKVIKEDYSLFPTGEIGLDYKDVKRFFLHSLDTYKIVFIDGVFSSHLSETTHAAVSYTHLTLPTNREV